MVDSEINIPQFERDKEAPILTMFDADGVFLRTFDIYKWHVTKHVAQKQNRNFSESGSFLLLNRLFSDPRGPWVTLQEDEDFLFSEDEMGELHRDIEEAVRSPEIYSGMEEPMLLTGETDDFEAHILSSGFKSGINMGLRYLMNTDSVSRQERLLNAFPQKNIWCTDREDLGSTSLSKFDLGLKLYEQVSTTCNKVGSIVGVTDTTSDIIIFTLLGVDYVIGTTYGFSERESLEAYRPDVLCDNPQQMKEALEDYKRRVREGITSRDTKRLARQEKLSQAGLSIPRAVRI